jgi:hypothetical protein
MQITNDTPGRRYAPLETIELVGAEDGEVIVSDALRRVYVRVPATSPLRFTVGGAPGNHTVLLLNNQGKLRRRLFFCVEAQTQLADETGEFAELLQMLYLTMAGDSEMGQVRWNGQVYHFFVRWLRDHVHTLKGMKYFSSVLKEGIDLYRDSQREDGMIWDNVYPRSGPNYWDVRFAEGDFIRPVDADGIEFKRIPVETDVEYLFVEGLYYTWKATGDDGWMHSTLDAAVRALDYCVTSPYRWSETHKLLKRGYTIDTWDFQDADDSVVAGDPMRVDLERTRFGVMFGDNTGYIASCRYLAEMLEHAGRNDAAARFRERAAQMQQRLDEVSWDGSFFIHHVPEQYGLIRDLGVDEDGQVSLSNAYSLNRGISHEQATAIIRTYQEIKSNLPEGSPGEWYTIYPPFQRGYGNHNSLWQYMNGGVTPIVAGELAHGAFEHGFEQYGVDILRRLSTLGKQHGARFHAVYTGAFPAPPDPTFTLVDISSYANIDTRGDGAPGVPGWTGEGENDLHELPGGEQEFAGIPFALPEPEQNNRRAVIGLRRADGYAEEVGLTIGETATSIYLLHCVSQTQATGVGGSITLRYVDGTSYTQYIVRGVNVSGWWFPEAPEQHGRRTAAVAWRGKNAMSPDVGLVAYGMDNPYPDKIIEQITLTASEDGSFWAVCGVTLSDQEAYFPPDPVSYGIPDNWAAAAVVYGLVEGLVGVVDKSTTYNHALVAPRWVAAGVGEAQATIAYPASDGYVAYRYRHDLGARQIELTVTGSGTRCVCHVLLPPYAQGEVAVSSGGELVPTEVVSVEQSRYVDFELRLPGPRHVIISY